MDLIGQKLTADFIRVQSFNSSVAISRPLVPLLIGRFISRSGVSLACLAQENELFGTYFFVLSPLPGLP